VITNARAVLGRSPRPGHGGSCRDQIATLAGTRNLWPPHQEEERKARRRALKVGRRSAIDQVKQKLKTRGKTSYRDAVLRCHPALERWPDGCCANRRFSALRLVGEAGGGSIDGLGDLPNIASQLPVFVQCSVLRFRKLSEVRDVRAAMAGRGDKGMLITKGHVHRRCTSGIKARRAQPTT